MNPFQRLSAKHTSGPSEETAQQWKRLQAGRQDHHRSENVKIFIQQDPSGDYWCIDRGWVATREFATVFIGVVEALDICISNSINADIILEFSGSECDVRLSDNPNR